ncbi:MAG: LPS export ABC transporter ATP-binding protein [Deltaproteobacteria bacterium]|nr:MAG: LPS export ABC transporter ATP-binding protein [Deltaproteobacteria bacterium]PIE74939.1 MAG: LPS export ABC transporter ATP-binding protein [Deltaproteobacteria bacterium]
MRTLYLKNLEKTYGKRTVVSDVSISIETSTIVGLLGPNGAGKTTTFNMAVGLISPDKGRVLLDDLDLTGYQIYKRGKKGIGYLPQQSSIFKKLSVSDNLKIILEHTSLSKSQINTKIDQLLKEFNISKLKHQKAESLSGGERRRLEISRVLSTDPDFVLLDEPFAGVDPIAVSDIQDIISYLAKKNIGVLISDHNVRETLGVCNTAYIINNGSIIKYGTPEEVAEDELVKKTYLGQDFKMQL